MQKKVASIEELPVYIPADRSEIVKVAGVGVGAGVMVALFGELIARYFIEPVFCRSTDSFAVCANGGMTAFYAATVIVTIAAVAVLATIGAFRPLLIGLAAAASLWGVKAYLVGLHWLEYGAWLAVLFGFVYVLFYWLLRARSFVLSLIITVVAVAAIRLVLAL